jgi:dipeptidyl aminopeptidase/acylaminoacyl peptidase
MNESADRSLVDWLHEGPDRGRPEALEQALAATRQTAQRPGWSLRERWIPMTSLTLDRVGVPRLPLRNLALLAVLAALVIGAVVVAGTRPRLPAPFGLAANGRVAYAAAGDIYTVDPLTGAAEAIVSGPEPDILPRFSRDGTRIAFVRGESGGRRLYVVNSDGQGLANVTPGLEELGASPWFEFSPDGASLVFLSTVDGQLTISIAGIENIGVRRLDVGMAVAEATLQPPDGSRIAFASASDAGDGLYLADVDTAGVRTLVPRRANQGIANLSWSPDGSTIAYNGWQFGPESTGPRVYLVSSDGTSQRALPPGPGSAWEGDPTWSNDGRRLTIARGYESLTGGVPAIVGVDGGRGVESRTQVFADECCPEWAWAPDDTSILVTPLAPSGERQQQLLLDPATGETRRTPWEATSIPTWQRLAP